VPPGTWLRSFREQGGVYSLIHDEGELLRFQSDGSPLLGVPLKSFLEGGAGPVLPQGGGSFLYASAHGNVKRTSLVGGVPAHPTSETNLSEHLYGIPSLLLDLEVGGVDQGAVWVLFLDGAFHATATPRNGLGGNALCLTNLSPPALGTSWDTEVEHGQHPGATLTILYGFALPSMGATIGAGELLVDVSSLRLFRHIVAAAGSSDLHSLAVPCDVTLAGLTATSQALVLGGAGPELCNAVDLVLGL